MILNQHQEVVLDQLINRKQTNMIKKIYSEWYDQEAGQVFSITEVRFLGILIYRFNTTTNSWNVISGYVGDNDKDCGPGLYEETNIGFKKTNEQTT